MDKRVIPTDISALVNIVFEIAQFSAVRSTRHSCRYLSTLQSYVYHIRARASRDRMVPHFIFVLQKPVRPFSRYNRTG